MSHSPWGYSVVPNLQRFLNIQHQTFTLELGTRIFIYHTYSFLLETRNVSLKRKPISLFIISTLQQTLLCASINLLCSKLQISWIDLCHQQMVRKWKGIRVAFTYLVHQIYSDYTAHSLWEPGAAFVRRAVNYDPSFHPTFYKEHLFLQFA